MQKEYVLRGLGCANCANKIETDVKAMNGVASASVNFMTATLSLDTLAGYKGNIFTDIETVVHKYEPEVVVIDKEHTDKKSFEAQYGVDDNKRKVLQLLVGAAVFVLGLLAGENESIKLILFLVSYAVLGGEIVLRALKNILKGQVFDENFLMSVATIGAFAIGEYPEAVAVMLFYQIGEYFQEAAVKKSKKSIADLMDIRPDFANIKRNGEIVRVSPDEVAVGDMIVVKPGEKIPLDGVIIEGSSSLDTKALTGESLPREVGISDAVISGCINQSGLLEIEVTKTFGESTVAKIIDLVENASGKKAPTENFITTFSRYYTPVVVVLAALIAVIPPLFLSGIGPEWIHRGLVFLVISCPCALVISIPLGFFGGIGAASQKGILVKGSNYLEALNNLDIVVFDKTGTLTKGVFEVMEVSPAFGYTCDELLEAAAYAETFSNHPIALSIRKAFGKDVEKDKLSDYKEIFGHGISVKAGSKNILAGNDRLMKEEKISFDELDKTGTKVYVAVNHQYAGYILISDEVKEDSRSTILGLKEKGVSKTVMLTGDNAHIGAVIAQELMLDEVYAELLPGQKVEKLETLDMKKRRKGKLAFVGDGINDAPVLARADIGVAMGGLGSDAAIEAADIVLMTDEPSKLLEAIDIAKYTKRIVMQNIIFALGIKGIILILGAFGAATMWEAVFADVGVSVIAILNSMRVLKMGQLTKIRLSHKI